MTIIYRRTPKTQSPNRPKIFYYYCSYNDYGCPIVLFSRKGRCQSTTIAHGFSHCPVSLLESLKDARINKNEQQLFVVITNAIEKYLCGLRKGHITGMNIIVAVEISVSSHLPLVNVVMVIANQQITSAIIFFS